MLIVLPRSNMFYILKTSDTQWFCTWFILSICLALESNNPYILTGFLSSSDVFKITSVPWLPDHCFGVLLPCCHFLWLSSSCYAHHSLTYSLILPSSHHSRSQQPLSLHANDSQLYSFASWLHQGSSHTFGTDC